MSGESSAEEAPPAEGGPASDAASPRPGRARAAAAPEAEQASPPAQPEATFADADPFSPGEVANREASAAAAEAASKEQAAEDHTARNEAEQADPPASYIADVALFTGDPASGTVPVRAFNPGDQVLPADVWRNGWREQVHAPEGYEPAEPSPEGDTP